MVNKDEYRLTLAVRCTDPRYWISFWRYVTKPGCN